MSPSRKWTIAIRPRAGEKLRKITKIIGLNGDGFSVLAPYHQARSGFLCKELIDARTFERRRKSWNEVIGFTAEDRVKLSYHIDGFAQFSSEAPGKIISGRDPKTGEPKGLGLLARSLSRPSVSGPSVSMYVWGIEKFEEAGNDENFLIFEPEDVYFWNCTPASANTWRLSIYAFAVGQVPRVQFEGEQAVMQYLLPSPTAGVPGSVVRLKLIHLKEEALYLGLCVERYIGDWKDVESGWAIGGPGNYTQYQDGYVLSAYYPSGPIPTEGRPALDRSSPTSDANPSAPIDAKQPPPEGNEGEG